MKLSKAIEILTAYMKGSDKAEPVDFDDACILSIEALEQVKESRFDPSTWEPKPLPGETPESEGE